jgi:hypothetical protein
MNHEQAAFKGAASVKYDGHRAMSQVDIEQMNAKGAQQRGPLTKDELRALQNACLPTVEQIAQQPWRYPQGRIPPEEEAEPNFALPWWENMMVWMFVIALAGVFWSAVYYIYRSLFP